MEVAKTPAAPGPDPFAVSNAEVEVVQAAQEYVKAAPEMVRGIE